MRCASSLKQRLLSPGKGDGTNVRNNTTKMLVYLSGSCERHESLEGSHSQPRQVECEHRLRVWERPGPQHPEARTPQAGVKAARGC